MLIPNLADVKHILNGHYVANIILCLLFPLTKGIRGACQLIYPNGTECGFDSREHEILIFLAVVIIWKNRKATNWLHYLANVFLFTKVASTFLFLRADPLVGTVYVLLSIVVTVLFPEPAYKGPEKVVYFQGDALIKELESPRKTYWVIQFYTTWSPECRHVTPVFAELSEKFTLPNLKFGKLDVGKFPKEAERFRINTHPSSRQLPTMSVFGPDGVEQRRRPLISKNGRAIPFVFSAENCIFDFDLNNLYQLCRKNLKNKPSEETQLKEEKKEQ
ncbi:hypothetical protein QR680_002819 [Steinernema hermaphroditum]|uniref:Thioredoxin domain-containing protein n=1 Tax=Steinernema hermaphroditum TaxID=289476 RepID=A0AA39H6V2_9BILA|nr:hypothetical protein QR680_002819 [Steinernema hermaphroditum]